LTITVRGRRQHHVQIDALRPGSDRQRSSRERPNASAPISSLQRTAARDVTDKRRILHTPYKTISSLKLLRGKIAEWSAGGRTYRRRIDTLGR